MKLIVTPEQQRALEKLRGLPDNAHLLLMTSRYTATGGILNGRKKAFTELVEHISEDLAAGMHPVADARRLAEVCLKIDAECADWLGM